MRYKLKQVCDFYSGTGFPVVYQGESSGDLPFYKVGDIAANVAAGNIYLSFCNHYISYNIAKELKGCILPKDVVVFAKIGEALKLNRRAMTSCSCLIDNNVMGIAAKPSVLDAGYFFYFMKSVKMEAYSESTTVPSVRKSTLERIEIPVPAMHEQQRIAAVLRKLQSIIAHRRQQLLKLDALVKARFAEMFGTVDDNRFGWAVKTIGDCCTLKSGTSLPAEVENEGGEIPYVKVGDMSFPGNERYITTSSRFVSRETAGRGVFPVGSILFPKRGGAIGTNKKRMTIQPVCADLNVMGVSSDGELLPEYLMTYFEMIDLSDLNNGSSVPQINNKDIAPLKICVPPMGIQREYRRWIEQTDRIRTTVQQALDEAQLLFDSLMQMYFGQDGGFQ